MNLKYWEAREISVTCFGSRTFWNHLTVKFPFALAASLGNYIRSLWGELDLAAISVGRATLWHFLVHQVIHNIAYSWGKWLGIWLTGLVSRESNQELESYQPNGKQSLIFIQSWQRLEVRKYWTTWGGRLHYTKSIIDPGIQLNSKQRLKCTCGEKAIVCIDKMEQVCKGVR